MGLAQVTQDYTSNVLTQIYEPKRHIKTRPHSDDAKRELYLELPISWDQFIIAFFCLCLFFFVRNFTDLSSIVRPETAASLIPKFSYRRYFKELKRAKDIKISDTLRSKLVHSISARRYIT
uniref:Uncharacterized protein n=1 Tax=Glossina pallidipes TaxID=7398 RepID=A0A1A9ZXK4_GLOPL